MYKNTIYCYNCGNNGHISKTCHLPIISNGIICYKINDTFNIDTIQFILIRKKYSLGYINFIRGKYELDNIESLTKLIDLMTIDEKKKLLNTDNNFDNLWKELWLLDSIESYLKEYNDSKNKFNKITNILNKHKLYDLIHLSTTNYTDQEWEFPKGRREKNETDLECAIREFEEETNMCNNDYTLLKLNPIFEDFIGSDNKKYRNNFYISKLVNHDIELTIENESQNVEISDIQLLSYNEIKNKLRPYESNKLSVLNSLIESLKFINNIK